MMPIYSYYDITDPECPIIETLKQHVNIALSTFDENSRLVRYGCSLRKTFYTTLRYSIILHDFGKVPFSQSILSNNKNNEKQKKLSFEGHEVISAWFADKYLNFVTTDNLIQPRRKGSVGDKELAVLAILLHHHPMRVMYRGDRFIGKEIYVNESSIEIFYKELEGIISPAYIPLQKTYSASLIYSEVFGDNGLFDRYWTSVWMNGSPTDRKTFLLLLQGLIVADYRSAALNRSPVSTKERCHSTISSKDKHPSKFAEAIKVYLSFYSSVPA